MDKLPAIGSAELQRSIGKVLRRIYLNKERLVVERGGFPVAVLVPYQEYEALMRQVEDMAGRKRETSKSKKPVRLEK